jgi:N-acetylmuramoyl-L-alanine amidase
MMRFKYRIRLFFIAITLFFVGQANLIGQSYLSIKLKPGEHINMLMERYLLDKEACNKEKFKSINNLSSDKILANQTYKLPIKVYSYDGNSIRTTIGSTDYEQAKRIQKYNEDLFAKKVKPENFRTGKKILWVPQHEIDCKVKSTDEKPLTAAEEERTFPIFGPKYQYVPLRSNKLKGKVYYIVSGHGGPDPGAVDRTKGWEMCEDEYAYDIALRLTRNLVAHGATVYMIVRDPNDGIRGGTKLTHDKDEYCYENQKIPLDQKERLKQRSDMVNSLYAYHKKRGVQHKDQKTIEIHIDSRSVDKRIDLFFYHHPNSTEGKKFATTLQQTIKAEYSKIQANRNYTGTVKSRDLFVLREMKTTTAYIELGNIKNVHDQKRFLLESNRQLLANWLFNGLIKAD